MQTVKSQQKCHMQTVYSLDPDEMLSNWNSAGLNVLKELLFGVYTETSIFYIFMLYMLIHTVLAIDFVVVLWNRVYNICTLYVLKERPTQDATNTITPTSCYIFVTYFETYFQSLVSQLHTQDWWASVCRPIKCINLFHPHGIYTHSNWYTVTLSC